MKYNYQIICYNTLLKDMPGRTGEVVSRRFGLKGERETLESVGQSYGITRERVRQIEEDGLRYLAKGVEDPRCQKVFHSFVGELKSSGGLKREDLLLGQLGGSRFKNHVYFLLTLGNPFQRFAETKDLHALWTIDRNSLNAAKKTINSFTGELKKRKQLLSLPKNFSPSYIEISKNVLKGPEGLYGLRDWPDINPRGIKDRAYIVLKKEEKPLHFARVASLINTSSLFEPPKAIIAQTVHNELIKDSRFVLVGRGLYALRDWGYEPGVVREVISRVLVKAKRPMGRDRIVKKVLGQRQVKPNTILLNLQNKKYFLKNSDGRYTVRRV